MWHYVLPFSDEQITAPEFATFLLLMTPASVVMATRFHVAIIAATGRLHHRITARKDAP